MAFSGPQVRRLLSAEELQGLRARARACAGVHGIPGPPLARVLHYSTTRLLVILVAGPWKYQSKIIIKIILNHVLTLYLKLGTVRNRFREAARCILHPSKIQKLDFRLQSCILVSRPTLPFTEYYYCYYYYYGVGY